jgi:hypothetical protein
MVRQIVETPRANRGSESFLLFGIRQARIFGRSWFETPE